MSGRRERQRRAMVRRIAEDVDRRKRAERAAVKMPAWRKALLMVGIGGPARRWTAAWERKHERAMQVTSRGMEKMAKRYHMRAGAPAAPQAAGK